jgi:uncharacterized membrane protein YidH (DUF202 family)
MVALGIACPFSFTVARHYRSRWYHLSRTLERQKPMLANNTALFCSSIIFVAYLVLVLVLVLVELLQAADLLQVLVAPGSLRS